MKKIILFLLTSFLLSCASGKSDRLNNAETKEKFAREIDTIDLQEHLYLLASDVLEGRKTGEKGQKMAVNYLTAYYEHLGLLAPAVYPEYLQPIPKSFMNQKATRDSENVLAYIEGTEYPDEVIVISAHYDHLGKEGEEVYNGADDNASGTSAVMEIAEAFQVAKNKGYGPKRSILFIHLTGEEIGLFGSKYYVRHPVFALDKTVINLNIDMVGRIDEKHQNKKPYIYLIGTKQLSSELHKLSESVNKEYTQLKLDYTYNSLDDPNRFYYRSDHYNFAENNIPVIFYFNGVHDDYHRPTDTPDKIQYNLLKQRTELVFYTAWEIANRKERLKVDLKPQ